MPKKDKKSKGEISPEELAALEARKAEKAAAKAAEKAAEKLARKAAKDGGETRETIKSDKKSDKKTEKKSDKKRADDDGMPRFKHVRRKKRSSGKGPTPQEIGESLVALFNAGKSDEAESTWYHRKIESIEEDGTVFEGAKGVAEKGAWWKSTFTVLSMHATGPYVSSTGFTVVYDGRVRSGDGTEIAIREAGVYTVEDGRIVREEFMRAAF
ncbi:MAG: hypothetical protein GC172_13235 [Phycisphaera sp.]|nr:hypothetical protein [Phycisphaera sp.]